MKNMFIKTSLMQYCDNNIDEILYDHDGIKMKELLLVSRIIYPLLNKANHKKVEAHMAHVTGESPCGQVDSLLGSRLLRPR
jgi:hypothetical protein